MNFNNIKNNNDLFYSDAVEELYHNEFCIGPDLNLRKIASTQTNSNSEIIDENNNEYSVLFFSIILINEIKNIFN